MAEFENIKDMFLSMAGFVETMPETQFESSDNPFRPEIGYKVGECSWTISLSNLARTKNCLSNLAKEVIVSVEGRKSIAKFIQKGTVRAMFAASEEL
jgi:hypothetical protein